MSGFIAMQREALEHPLFRGNPERFYAWFWLVARAAWKPTPFDVGGKVITLERGQLCVSRSQMADALKWSPSAVERFLSRLETEQMIGRATGQGRTIITICNYAKYQDKGEKTGQATEQPTGQRPDSDRTVKEQGNHSTIQEANASCAPKAVKRSPLKALPEDWQPILTPSAQRIVDGWPPGRLEREAGAFRDHAADKGRTSRDWQAAFRKWIENAEKWHPGHGRQQGQHNSPSTRDAVAGARELLASATAGHGYRAGGAGPMSHALRAIGHGER